MFFEGQVNLPKDASDVDRFDADLRACKEAGAEIVRAAALTPGGRALASSSA